MRRFRPLPFLAAALLMPSLLAVAEERAALPTDDGSAPAADLPVGVAPNDPHLGYAGRFDHTDPQAPLCAWPASAVTLRFRGTAVQANLDLSGNRFEVAVDGTPVKVIRGDGKNADKMTGAKPYSLASGLSDREHTVTLFKCTEARCGTAQFRGFQLNAGASVLLVPAPSRMIEVIGDSISAGYGNEASGQGEHFSAATENAYWTYGALAARAVGASYTCIASSGRTLWPTFTVPEIFDRIIPRDASSSWPGDQRPQDVIVINLGTNDFYQKAVADEDAWVHAYLRFLAHLRTDAPRAAIYCALSPMMNDLYPQGVRARTKGRGYIQRVVAEANAAGDSNVRFLEFAEQDPANGLGADSHPSVKTQRIMAETLLAALNKGLGWQARDYNF